MNVFLTGIQLTKRGLMVVTIPYFSFFTWYYVFSSYLLRFLVEESSSAFTVFYSLFNFLVAFSLVLSSFFVRRFDRTSPIYLWSAVSSVGTLFAILVPNTAIRIAFYLLSGIIFGVGLLSFSAYFWELTAPEERGRVLGLVGFLYIPVFSVITILAGVCGFWQTALLCVALNLATLAIRPLYPKRTCFLTTKTRSEGYNVGKRTILLYLVPWMIFSLLNSTLAKSISFHISRYFDEPSLMLLRVLQTVGVSLGALTGGAIADFFGRRLSLALGLTLYGFSTAISGITESYEMFYLVFLSNGLNWGIFLVVYSFVVWGDLATIETCHYMYAIGLAVSYSTAGLGALVSSQLMQIPLTAAAIISCSLIFLSNAPLVLAPELLSSDFREKIRLRLYISFVRKMIQG
jgi:MFS family permease